MTGTPTPGSRDSPPPERPLGHLTGLSARAVVAALPDAVLVLDGRLRVLSANEAAARLLGVEDPRGLNLFALVPDEDAWIVHRGVATALASDEPVATTHRLHRRDGEVPWLDTTVRAIPRPDAREPLLLATCRDVTERVLGDQRLATVNATWADVWQVMHEGVIVIDRDGIVVMANRAAAEFLGLEEGELQGSLARAHVVVLDENGAPMRADRLPSSRAFRTGVAHEESLAYRRRDNSVVWLRARAVPFCAPGGTSPDRVAIMLENAVGPAMDVTESRPHGGRLAAVTREVLTARELEVLRLLAQGEDVRSVASSLGISIHTARGHVKSLMRKLDARTQLQAVVLALRAELLELP